VSPGAILLAAARVKAGDGVLDRAEFGGERLDGGGGSVIIVETYYNSNSTPLLTYWSESWWKF
jgi:hypothetical protein